MVDNNGAIDLAKIDKKTVSNRSKHIEVQYHFWRETVQTNNVNIRRWDTTEQVADSLTKPLERVKHQYFSKLAGLNLKSIRPVVQNIEPF